MSDEPEYVIGRAPAEEVQPFLAVANYAVCRDCDKDRPRALRCDGCPMTLMQDGKLPSVARLIRW
jgi:hypothetical protein